MSSILPRMGRRLFFLAILVMGVVLFLRFHEFVDMPEKHSHTFYAMGGIPVELVYFGLSPEEMRPMLVHAEEQVLEWENELSLYKPESVLNRLSHSPGTRVPVSRTVWDALSFSREAWEVSGGAFDITVGPLMKEWQAAEDRQQLPDPARIADILSQIGFQRIVMDPDPPAIMIQLLDSSALEPVEFAMDIGGIAKGLFSQWIYQTIQETLSDSARDRLVKLLVNTGGDMYCHSSIRETPCIIGIQDPFAPADARGGALWGELNVMEGAVVTSGTYERFFTIQNKTYSHFIDPRTGYPAETDLVSVTVIDPNGAMADALATTMFLLGDAEGLKLVESRPETDAVLIHSDGTWVASSGIGSRLKVY